MDGLDSCICYNTKCGALMWQFGDMGIYSTSTNCQFWRCGSYFYTTYLATYHSTKDSYLFMSLAQNRLMTRDILKRRNMHKPEDSMFWSELESQCTTFSLVAL